jgi:hypothetical protein
LIQTKGVAVKPTFVLVLVLVLAAALAAGTANAAGIVQVRFVEPERFTDIRDRASTREQNLGALEKLIVEVAARYVADGQTLAIEVTDVDMAGEPSPGRPIDLRVMRGGADWPRIRLDWHLTGGAAQPRSGSAVVQDMNYLDHRLSGATQHLRFERRMLEAWFREQFGQAAGN